MVLTVRADFLGEALRFPAMAAALESAVTTIGQMGRSQLRAVIENPLPAGMRYEPGLVERILNDVGEDPGSLPLLEFTLTLLWERQEGGLLTHAAYDKLGRVDGALATYAERVYSDDLMPDEQQQARRLLSQLVRPTDVGTPVRRVARRYEMSDAQWELGQRLAVTRLVVADRDAAGAEAVELVHEALISGWSRLDAWVREDLEFRKWQEQLRTAIAGWERMDHDAGALLRGVPLTEAEHWLNNRRADLTETEQRFILASRAAQERFVKRLRIAVVSLTLLLILVLNLGGVALLAFVSYSEQTQRDELVRIASSVAIDVSGQVYDDAPIDPKDLKVIDDYAVAVYAEDGDRLAGAVPGDHRRLLSRALDGEVRSQTEGDLVAATFPVTHGDDVVGAVLVTAPRSAVVSAVLPAWGAIATLTIGVVTAAWVIARRHAKPFLRPTLDSSEGSASVRMRIT